MRNADFKTRHAVQMACAARALARAAPSDHLKRVLARYAFVHLDDVVRYGATWCNRLRKNLRTQPTAQASMPALQRLRRDWSTYQDVRDFIAAKRQPRDADAAVDQFATFKMWLDIGQLSVETLVDDAVELFVQLAALESLPPVEAEPVVNDAVRRALAEFDPIGSEAFLEVNASSFGGARPNTVSVRMGGAIGRLIPLINDVGESAALLTRLASVPELDEPIRRLVLCALPSEIYELLRLTVGPPASAQTRTRDSTSLLALYAAAERRSDALTVLEHLDASFPQETQESLLDWRNRLGAHTDDETPWETLEEGIDAVELEDYTQMFDWIDLQLQHAACTAGGPVLLMLGNRRFKSMFSTEGYGDAASYADVDTASDPGEFRSALPPEYADSEHVWVNGPQGSVMSAAVAGMIAGRSREIMQRLEQHRAAYQARSGRGRRGHPRGCSPDEQRD